MTRPSDWTDAQLVEAMLDEMRICEAPLEFVLRPHVALQLACMLQLALRHPTLLNTDSVRRAAVTFIEHVRSYFTDHAALGIMETLRRGYVTDCTITCPRCGMVSYNVHDIQHQYCGACRAFIEGL